MKLTIFGIASMFLTLLACTLLIKCTATLQDAGFQLHPDFSIELVASEPIVLDPVDLEFDQHGDAYVLQMPGYPAGIDQSSIVRLVDNDGDGVYDSNELFADNLRQASSLMAYKSGFLVAAPPELLYLKDNDGDGTCDERIVIMDGFYDGNLQHNFNGITYSLDGWIYFANGGNGGSAYWADRPDSMIRIGASDFRIYPDKHLFELTGRSSGGYEIAINEWGDIFGTHNMYHIRSNVFPFYYINGLPLDNRELLVNISDHDHNGLSRLYPIGEQETRVNHPEQSGYFSGGCGITYYGGGAFSEAYRDNVFVNDVVLNLVHRDVLSANGNTYSAARGRTGVEFLASSDRSFRPVNSTVGPDGALYIIDMHRQVIEHPEWIPDELEKNMDLDAGKDKGRIYRISEKSVNLHELKPEINSLQKLVQMLQHESQWHRLTAQRLLIERQDANSVTLLRKAYSLKPDTRTQVSILYLLASLEDEISDLLLSTIETASAGPLLDHVLRLSEPYIAAHVALRDQVINLSGSNNIRTKMQVALTLSTLPAQVQNEIEMIYLEALLLIARTGGLEDPYTRIALAAAAKNQLQEFTFLLSNDSTLSNQKGFYPFLGLLATINTQKGSAEDQLNLLKNFSARDNTDTLALTLIIGKYQERPTEIREKEVSLAWEKYLDNIEEMGDLDLTAASWKLRKSLRIADSNHSDNLIGAALVDIEDQQKSPNEKLALLNILAHAKPDIVTDKLIPLTAARNPLVIQEKAMEVLGDFRSTATMQKLVDQWSSLSPSSRRKVTDLLIYTPEFHDLLFTSFESGVLNLNEFNFDLERRRRLLNSKDRSTATRANALFSDAGVVQRKDAINAMRPSLTLVGNANRGQKVFMAQCASCHLYGSIGKVVGPDLTEISRKSKETLLYDILDPNAGADPEFINHIIETRDNKVYTGIIGNETDQDIQLIMSGGTEASIAKSQIKSMQSTGLSLMPEGLENTIDLEQMADLLAFLQKAVL